MFTLHSTRRLVVQAQLLRQTRKFLQVETNLTKACSAPLLDLRTDLHMLFTLGTDHQRIAKLDRENEVAPPSKIAPSVGRVRLPLLSFFLSNY